MPGGKPVDPVPEGTNVGDSVERLSVMGLPSVEDGVSEVEGNSVREVVSVGNSSVLVGSSVVDGRSVGSVLVGTLVGKIVGNVSVLIESDGTISLVEEGMTGLTSVEEAGDGTGQVKVPLVDVAGNPDDGAVPVAGVLSELSLVNGGMSMADVDDAVTGDSSVELAVVVTPVDNGTDSVGRGITSV